MIGADIVETSSNVDKSLMFFSRENLQQTDSSTAKFSSLPYGDVGEETCYEVKEEGRISFKVVSRDRDKRPAPVPVEKPDLKKEVDAVVVAVEEVSVICEVLLGKENIEIQLPKALFPQKPYYGMPISISLDESSGYTVPVVRKRVVAADSWGSEKKELAALVDNL